MHTLFLKGRNKMDININIMKLDEVRYRINGCYVLSTQSLNIGIGHDNERMDFVNGYNVSQGQEFIIEGMGIDLYLLKKTTHSLVRVGEFTKFRFELIKPREKTYFETSTKSLDESGNLNIELEGVKKISFQGVTSFSWGSNVVDLIIDDGKFPIVLECEKNERVYIIGGTALEEFRVIKYF